MIPLNAPTPQGNEVELGLFVDSSHANDKVSHCSRSGYFIFINMALIGCLSKKQPTIETSVFGDEFTALKNGMGGDTWLELLVVNAGC